MKLPSIGYFLYSQDIHSFLAHSYGTLTTQVPFYRKHIIVFFKNRNITKFSDKNKITVELNTKLSLSIRKWQMDAAQQKK